jgi:hypothetical protein
MRPGKQKQKATVLGVLVASFLVFSGFFTIYQYYTSGHKKGSKQSLRENAALESSEVGPGVGSSSGTQRSPEISLRKPSAENQVKEGLVNDKPLTETDIQTLIQDFSNPQNFADNKVQLFKLSNGNKRRIFNYLTKKMDPTLDLSFVLRALDVIKLLCEDDPQLPQIEIIPILRNFLNEKNPLLVRGSLRVLSVLPSEEALKILAGNLNQEDSAISAEIMNQLGERARRQDSGPRDLNLDQEIIKTLEHYRISGQNNLEINEAAIRALIGIKGSQSFDYLSEQLNRSDINLDLKNEIALGLGAWGPRSLSKLRGYLSYLKSLPPVPNPLVDRIRVQGILQTQNAIQGLQ